MEPIQLKNIKVSKKSNHKSKKSQTIKKNIDNVDLKKDGISKPINMIELVNFNKDNEEIEKRRKDRAAKCKQLLEKRILIKQQQKEKEEKSLHIDDNQYKNTTTTLNKINTLANNYFKYQDKQLQQASENNKTNTKLKNLYNQTIRTDVLCKKPEDHDFKYLYEFNSVIVCGCSKCSCIQNVTIPEWDHYVKYKK